MIVRSLVPLALAALLLSPLSSRAVPSGGVQVAVVPFGAPCGPFNRCPVNGGVLIPMPDGSLMRQAGYSVLGQEFNDARAVVALRPVPGQPLDRFLQLGVRASMDEVVALTEDGLPGLAMARERMPVHYANASASFSDRLQFLDANLALGAQIGVSLTWTLSSDYCSGGRANCRLRDPIVPRQLPPDTFRTHADSSTAIRSLIELPGGPDVAEDSFMHSASHYTHALSGYVAQRIVGRPHELTHSFTVINGSAYDFTLAATASITLDGANLVNWNVGGPQPFIQRPVQRALNLLDYDDTLHLTSLQGIDLATGQPLNGLRMVTSLGLAVLPEALSPVPEPSALVLMLAGLGLLAVRRLRRGLPLLALLASPLAVQAQRTTPEVWVEGIVCCDDNGGQSYAQRAAAGLIGDGRQVLGPTGSALSQAIAGFGFLRLLGEVGYGGSNAAAGFVDQITLLPSNPAWLGEFATLHWRFAVQGGVLQSDLGPGGYGSITVWASALNALPGSGSRQTQWVNPEDAKPEAIFGDPLPWLVDVRQAFVFGEPFAVGFQLDLSVGANQAYGLADLFHTATWQGITQVSLAGQALGPADYSLIAASSTDYRGAITPVPEPAAAWLWLAALPALWRRARRSNARARTGATGARCLRPIAGE